MIVNTFLMNDKFFFL